MHTIIRRLLPLALLLALTACGSGPSGPGGGDAVVVGDDVRVLTPAAREHLRTFDLDLDSGEGEIRFAADDAFASALVAGEILVTEPVPGVAPHGFLQRVEATTTEGDEIVVSTSQATLEEVFEHAEVHFERQLRPADVIESHALYDGVALHYGTSNLEPSAGVGFDFQVSFDEVLVDGDGDAGTTDDQLRIDGSFDFDASASADIDIDWFTLESFHAKVGLEESVNVRLGGDVAGGFSERIEVARLDFGTFTVMVGPVPVVFVLDMVVRVGADGTIDATLEATAEQSTSVQVGAQYTDDGGWKDLNEFDSTFAFPTPTVTASASAGAYLQPRVNLKIYGLAGPFAYAEAFVEADAQLHRAPFWTFTAGLDFGVGFEIELPVVGRLGQWSSESRVLEHTLGESENEGPAVELLAPADPAYSLDGSRVAFDVRATDREQDEVTVQLLDEAGAVMDTATATPGGTATLLTDYLCVDTHEFRVRAIDDEGATDTGSPVTVIVSNRDPEVTIDRDQVAATPVYAGLYTSVLAEAVDYTCGVVGDSADDELVEWEIDGVGGGTGRQFFFRAPSQPFTVTASYLDDGGSTGTDGIQIVPQSTSGQEFPPTAYIRRPDGDVTWTGCSDGSQGRALYLEGTAVDPETGDLSHALQWTLTKLGTGESATATGASPVVYPCTFDTGSDTWGVWGGYRLDVTVEDEQGLLGTDSIDFQIVPEG